jgi:hypothetical protein
MSSTQFNECWVIEGDLQIQDIALNVPGFPVSYPVVQFSYLYYVSGDVVVKPYSLSGGTWRKDALGVRLPELLHIGGDLNVERYCYEIEEGDCSTIYQNERLDYVTLPKLETVGGDITIKYNPELTEVWMPEVSSVGGNLTVGSNVKLCATSSDLGQEPTAFDSTPTLFNNKTFCP